MKKITKLEELKKLDKSQLLDEMMKGTIKGGSSCGIIVTPWPPDQTLHSGGGAVDTPIDI